MLGLDIHLGVDPQLLPSLLYSCLTMSAYMCQFPLLRDCVMHRMMGLMDCAIPLPWGLKCFAV